MGEKGMESSLLPSPQQLSPEPCPPQDKFPKLEVRQG